MKSRYKYLLWVALVSFIGLLVSYKVIPVIIFISMIAITPTVALIIKNNN